VEELLGEDPMIDPAILEKPEYIVATVGGRVILDRDTEGNYVLITQDRNNNVLHFPVTLADVEWIGSHLAEFAQAEVKRVLELELNS
jgi:hypothetical protein